LRPEPYAFPGLPPESFLGRPALPAASLPDRFGNALIDAWLALRGRPPGRLEPVERLCYIGTRGMRAREFRPPPARRAAPPRPGEIDALTRLANDLLNVRLGLAGDRHGGDDRDALEDILRVGSSAGGARAKAVLAWNPDTGEFRSGQVRAGEGFGD